jgi:DNA-binding GntR family transcriptional regulator
MASKRDIIYGKMREAILRGDLLPGELISERTVAESLGASRMPMREALIQLQSDGLITVIPQRGAFVRKFSAAELDHLYELRGALEGLAAARAALTLPSGALDSFCRSFTDALESGDLQPEAAEELGLAFHERVFEGCGNPLVCEMAATIQAQVQLAKRMSYHHASPEQVRRGVKEHLDIGLAIAAGDSAAAESQMKAHIASWSRDVRESMDRRAKLGLRSVG